MRSSFLENAIGWVLQMNVTRTLIFLMLCVIFIHGLRIVSAEPSLDPFSTGSISDFEDYHNASKLMSEGEDPYRLDAIDGLDTLGEKYSAQDLLNPEVIAELMDALRGVGTYLYLPFFAWLLSPLAGLEYAMAAIVYQVVSFLALLGFLVFLFYHVYRFSVSEGYTESNGESVSASVQSSNKKYAGFFHALLISLLITGGFLAENAGNGNVNFFLILLCGIGLLYSFSEKNTAYLKELTGGFLIGLATVIKITPGFFGLVLFAGKRWTAILGMFLGFGFGIIIPALSLGWQGNLELIQGWKVLILETYNQYAVVRPWANNQSISAAISKLFIIGSDMKQQTYGLPIIFTDGLPGPFAQKLLIGLVQGLNGILLLVAIIVGLVLHFKRPLVSLFDHRMALFIWMVSLVSLLTSGVSWYHAYGILFIPIFLRLYLHFSSTQHISKGEKYSLYAIAAFGFFEMFLSSYLRELLAMYSIFTWIAIVITIYLCIKIIRISYTSNDVRNAAAM